MSKKAIVVEMPIIEGLDFLEIAKTFDDEQLSYVVALAKAYSDLEQEHQRKDYNWNELKEFILNHYIVGHTVQNSSLDMIINKMKELESGE